MKTVHTCCQICEQMCGLAVHVGDDGKVVRIDPDKENRHNWRDYCVKGALSHLSLEHPLRIRRPMKRVGDRYVETSYDEAVEAIGGRLRRIIDRHGPHAVATFLGNPGGFSFGGGAFFGMLADAIGTRNKYFTGSIDQNGLHLTHEAVFGSPWTALQQDVDACRCFLYIGTNPAISAMNWQGHVPDGWRRTLAAQAKGATLIVVDPRRTETAAKADLHVAPLPESDWAFVLALIRTILDRGWENPRRFDRVSGLDVVRDIAAGTDTEELARRCDVPVATIERVAETFAKAPTAMAVARTGVGQGRNGTITLWLTAVLNLITDRIDAPGGLFYARDALLSLLEVGAEVLPATRSSSRVRGSPSIVGFLPVAELPDEINTPGEGQVRALLIQGGNPIVTGPDGRALAEALGKLELLVCCDLFQRETHRFADWLIPAVHMLEREELHMLIHSLAPHAWAQMSRQVVPLSAGMKPEWEFFRDLALHLDLPLIPGKRWANPLLRASRWIPRITGDREHSFSPRVLARIMLAKSKSIRWKDVIAAEHGVGTPQKPIEFGALFDSLRTVDGKVNGAPRAFVDALRQRLAEPASRTDAAEFPLQIITRRRMHLMNSWSHETSVTNMKRLAGDRIEINPGDAARHGLADGDRVRVRSVSAEVVAIAVVSDAVRPGVAVMEHGWGGRTYDPRGGSALEHGGVNRNLLVSNADLDPLSGVPRLNGTPVSVERLPADP